MTFDNAIPQDLRKLLQFGTGVGIQIGATDLEVAAARVRPSGVHVLGRITIANYAARPASEWGEEYAAFLKRLGLGHLSATVLLPRREVIVRQLPLPGVSPKDMEGAIRFQLDSLHPYGEEEISWGWSRLAYGSVLVGIVRRSTVQQYYDLFTAAGVMVASFTFSAAAVHAAIRLNGAAARVESSEGFVALSNSAGDAVEVYGESQARPVFSAEFEMAPQRAASLALSELRLPPETAVLHLEDLLPKPAVNPVENDLSRNALPYATALAGACPRLAPSVNVLAPEQRRSSSRAVYIPTAVLALILLLTAAGIFAYSKYAERVYLRKLQAEIARLTPLARRADDLDQQIRRTRERSQLLDQFRTQTRADLDALNELTRLVEPPAWSNNTILDRNSVRIYGEAPSAPPLLRILDSSPLFGNSALDSNTKGGIGERFQIHATRKYPNQ